MVTIENMGIIFEIFKKNCICSIGKITSIENVKNPWNNSMKTASVSCILTDRFTAHIKEQQKQIDSIPLLNLKLNSSEQMLYLVHFFNSFCAVY